jgi:hypothetical protein
MIMDKHVNLYLAKALKQWVSQIRPPADGRARLLQKAAIPHPQSSNKFALSWITGQGAVRPDIFGAELQRKLTGWIDYSFHPGYGNLSVV